MIIKIHETKLKSENAAKRETCSANCEGERANREGLNQK